MVCLDLIIDGGIGNVGTLDLLIGLGRPPSLRLKFDADHRKDPHPFLKSMKVQRGQRMVRVREWRKVAERRGVKQEVSMGERERRRGILVGSSSEIWTEGYG